MVKRHYNIKLTANSWIALCSSINAVSFFIGADDEMLFVAVSVHYSNRSPIKIQG